MILKTLISMLRCVWSGLELNSAGKWISRDRFEYLWATCSFICQTANEKLFICFGYNRFHFQINCVFWTFYSSKNPKNIFNSVSTKILSSANDFNIDCDKKCFLNTKSADCNDVWRIMLTLKTGAMMLKIQLCHDRNKLHLKIYWNWKHFFNATFYFTILMFYCIFHQINAILVSYKTVKHKKILIISNF